MSEVGDSVTLPHSTSVYHHKHNTHSLQWHRQLPQPIEHPLGIFASCLPHSKNGQSQALFSHLSTLPPPNAAFLTWARLFDDLKLCFDLPFALLPNDSEYFGTPPPQEREAAAAMGMPCIYFEQSRCHLASQADFLRLLNSSIDITALVGAEIEKGAAVDDDGDDDEDRDQHSSKIKLDLTAVVHDTSFTLVLNSDLKLHLDDGSLISLAPVSPNYDVRTPSTPASILRKLSPHHEMPRHQ